MIAVFSVFGAGTFALIFSFAVITALPGLRPVTLPLSSTVATPSRPVDQDTDHGSVIVEVSGDTVKPRSTLPPGSRVALPLLSLMPLAYTLLFTVTWQVRVWLPVLAVIVHLPAFRAFTLPPEDTVATARLEELHCTAPEAQSTFSVSDRPAISVRLVLERLAVCSPEPPPDAPGSLEPILPSPPQALHLTCPVWLQKLQGLLT